MKTRSFYSEKCFLQVFKINALLFILLLFSYKANAYGDWWPHTAACYGTPVWLTACPMPAPDYCTLTYGAMLSGPLRIGWWYMDASSNVHDMFDPMCPVGTYHLHLVSDLPANYGGGAGNHALLAGNPFSDHSMVAFGGPWPNGSFTWLSPGIVPGDPGYAWVTGNNTHILYSSSQLANSAFTDESYNPYIYPAIQVPGTSHHVTCNGYCNGSITITPNGGSGTYPSYHWSNGAPTQNVSNLCAGSYSVTVTDGNSCTARNSYTINQPLNLVLQSTILPATCAGSCDGSIDLTVAGGCTPYTYIWNNGAVSQDIGSIVQGIYSVTVSDCAGCIKSGSFTVTAASPGCQDLYIPDVTVTDVRCYSSVQTIHVGGPVPTTIFSVMPGGSVTLIAGQNIIYYPGTIVYPGGYLLGYIAPCGPWCTFGPVSIVTVPPEPEPENYPVNEKSFFTVYPNPTTGFFSLETKGIEESAQLKVEIYGIQGDRVFSANVKGKKKYDFSLSGKRGGVYFIRVVSGKYAGTSKLIKQ
jgi:hypothetical protein